MATTWDVTYRPVSEGSKTVTIVGVATDSAAPGNPITVQVEKANIATIQDEDKALDVLYMRYLAKKSEAQKIATWLEGKEDKAKTNLEART